jgi:hypothetical protein
MRPFNNVLNEAQVSQLDKICSTSNLEIIYYSKKSCESPKLRKAQRRTPKPINLYPEKPEKYGH